MPVGLRRVEERSDFHHFSANCHEDRNNTGYARGALSSAVLSPVAKISP
jgi:hypothetical protein